MTRVTPVFMFYFMIFFRVSDLLSIRYSRNQAYMNAIAYLLKNPWNDEYSKIIELKYSQWQEHEKA